MPRQTRHRCQERAGLCRRERRNRVRGDHAGGRGGLEVNDVIIFNREDIKTVHRIISIDSFNGETRYYTKGDANVVLDDGYVIKDDIIGTTIFRIRYIGYPTLWLRDIFKR